MPRAEILNPHADLNKVLLELVSSWFSSQFIHVVSLLTLAWSVTPHIILLHISSVLNMHVWSPEMSVGIMLDCGDSCTQLTTPKSPHNKQSGRFCCRLVLTSRSFVGGELCCVANWLKWNGQTQVVDDHKRNTYVMFWCMTRMWTSYLLQRLMTM
jgi:hypothetical protein